MSITHGPYTPIVMVMPRPWFVLVLGSSLVLGGCRGDDQPGDQHSSETVGDGDGDGDLREPSVTLVRADGSTVDPATEPVPLGVRVALSFDPPVPAEDREAIEAELGLVGPDELPVRASGVWSNDGAELRLAPRGLLDPQTDYELRTGAAWVELAEPQLAASAFGFRTKLASDFDGDGFADLVVAAPGRALAGTADVGALMVHSGSASGVGSTASLVLTGVGDSEESFGLSHAAVDLDGDGFDELIVGAPGRNGFTGAVEIRYGSGAGLAADADAILVGAAASEFFGARVAAIGDVDKDGFEDLALAAPRAEVGGEPSVGRIQVHRGGPSGIGPSPDLELDGDGAYAEFGTWMTAGDFDDDGFDDLVVCAPRFDQGRGLAQILPGTASGPSLDPARRVSLIGENPQDTFCSHPAVADVNGDAIDDLAIGALGWAEGVGAVAVYPGSELGVDPAVFDRLIGDAQPDLFGLVSAAGDLDDDGDDELLIGAPFATAGARDGVAYVHDGGPAGPAQVPSAVWTGAAMELFGLVYPPLDLDGDGHLDAIIAAPGYAGQAGRVLIYPGDEAGFAVMSSVIIEGETADERLGDYLPPT